MSPAVESTRVGIWSLSDELKKRPEPLILLGDGVKYTQAFNQFDADLALLTAHAADMPALLAAFNAAFNNPAFAIDAESAKAFFETTRPVGIAPTFSPEQQAEDRAAPLLGQDLVDAWEVPEGDAGQAKLKVLTQLMIETMGACSLELGLPYHNPFHPLEVEHDAAFLVEKAGLPEYKIVAGCAGKLHDGVFWGVRCDDERNSADLLLTALAPLMSALDETQQALLRALVRVLIVGGTLPVVLAPQRSEGGPDFSRLQMNTLWEVYQLHYGEGAVPEEMQILCRAMSDADVNRSLTPELLDAYCVKEGFSFPHCPLSHLVEGYHDKQVAAGRTFTFIQAGCGKAPLEKEHVREMVLVKLGQSMRFMVEDKAKAEARAVTVEEKDPSDSSKTIKRAKTEAEIQASKDLHRKLFCYLRYGRKAVFTPAEIEAVSSWFGGEQFFAGMNIRGFALEKQLTYSATPSLSLGESAGRRIAWSEGSADAHGGAGRRRRSSTFVQESWEWHKEVYADLSKELKTLATSTDAAKQSEANALFCAMLDNAINQQGRFVDLNASAQLVLKTTSVVSSESATAAASDSVSESGSSRPSTPVVSDVPVQAPVIAAVAPQSERGCSWSNIWRALTCRNTDAVKPGEPVITEPAMLG